MFFDRMDKVAGDKLYTQIINKYTMNYTTHLNLQCNSTQCSYGVGLNQCHVQTTIQIRNHSGYGLVGSDGKPAGQM